jgi:hypothetical protein
MPPTLKHQLFLAAGETVKTMYNQEPTQSLRLE